MTAQYKYDNYTDAKLAEAVNVALKASDGAGKAQAILGGQLLAVGRKRYPADVDFEKFLKLIGGVGLRRARDLIAISAGRKDYEKELVAHREAGYRYREQVKAAKQEAVKADALANASKAEKAAADATAATAVAAKAEQDQAFDAGVEQVGNDPSINPEGFNAPRRVVTALHLTEDGRLSVPSNLVPPAGTRDPFAAFAPVKKPKTEPRVTAAGMKKMAEDIKAELTAVTAPPIAPAARDIEDDEAARMDVALLKRGSS